MDEFEEKDDFIEKEEAKEPEIIDELLVDNKKKKPKKDFKREMIEWVTSILVAVAVALLIRSFIFTVVMVEGSSMVPSLENKDRLIVTRLNYTPKHGDIIILQQEGKFPYVKRVIGLPGDKVDIDFVAKKVFVNDKELDEDYIYQPTSKKGDISFPVIVPEDSVFVLGDNRNNSRDSRYSDVGMVTYDDIIGKAQFRIYPFNNLGSVYENYNLKSTE